MIFGTTFSKPHGYQANNELTGDRHRRINGFSHVNFQNVCRALLVRIYVTRIIPFVHSSLTKIVVCNLSAPKQRVRGSKWMSVENISSIVFPNEWKSGSVCENRYHFWSFKMVWFHETKAVSKLKGFTLNFLHIFFCWSTIIIATIFFICVHFC